MAENERKEEAAMESLPELETLCSACEGDPDYNGNPSGPWRPCGSCGGAGHIPTEFGEKVLALIRHNILLDSGTVSWR
jgi:hypothetical protein